MNLVSHVHETAMTQPDKAAYHFMGKDTSYAEFDQSVSMFASALQDLGVGKRGSCCISARQYSAFSHFAVCDNAAWCDRNSSQSDLYAGRNLLYFT